jgi:hypothetical protein
VPKYEPKKSAFITTEIEGKQKRLLSADACAAFSTTLLGLGDLTEPASSTDSIAAVFDLEGFTNFCKQIEPHLSVPLFLSQFLTWLMNKIKSEMIKKEHKEGTELWSPLPFFVKFMGDGLLVLWDSTDMSEVNRRNVLVSLHIICQHYSSHFLPEIQKKVVDPPAALRCGVARGTVYSVGNGNDFVGSCINMASRIQKLPGVSFAFNRRGFDIEGSQVDKFFKERIVIKRVSIRGIGENELIGIRKSEFESLKVSDKDTYRNA